MAPLSVVDRPLMVAGVAARPLRFLSCVAARPLRLFVLCSSSALEISVLSSRSAPFEAICCGVNTAP
jgi:hypothetical protein